MKINYASGIGFDGSLEMTTTTIRINTETLRTVDQLAKVLKVNRGVAIRRLLDIALNQVIEKEKE